MTLKVMTLFTIFSEEIKSITTFSAICEAMIIPSFVGETYRTCLPLFRSIWMAFCWWRLAFSNSWKCQVTAWSTWLNSNKWWILISTRFKRSLSWKILLHKIGWESQEALVWWSALPIWKFLWTPLFNHFFIFYFRNLNSECGIFFFFKYEKM